MKICLIGYGIPCLLLANILSNKNINISIFNENYYENKSKTRTVGITKKNLHFLTNEKIFVEKFSWSIKNIKIFNDLENAGEILNFGPANDKLFSIIKNFQFINLLKKNIKKSKSVKIVKKNKEVFYNSIINNQNQFDLIINFNSNNKISREIFFKRQYKDYDSLAYTALIKHQKCFNRMAYQVFTKFGPIAFLPCSDKETSIVFSLYNKFKNLSEVEILELIKKYNKKFSIKSLSKFEKINLKGSLLKNYYYKNILCFGDNLHKIHPLAGQGLNMTIRDIKVLSRLIDKKIDLGLSLDQSILKEFESETKHLNYLYASSIDFIFDFFKFDNKFNNNYSKKIFFLLEKNSLFKKYSTIFADTGFI
tara:strand:- start:416 stop:1510 length:1095 start_codon:yes stop_codon:yes gene_type:complete